MRLNDKHDMDIIFIKTNTADIIYICTSSNTTLKL